MNKFLDIFKNMNLKNWRFKIFTLLPFSFLIVVPFLVFGAGRIDEGWRVNGGLTEKVTYYNSSANSATSSTCIVNSSLNDYFVPTKTYNEWMALTTRMASRGMAPSTCPVAQSCGDLECDINENTDNCPADCGIQGITCPTSIDFVDEVSGLMVNYPTTQIGGQCWMQKNMNFLHENQ